MGWKKNRFLSSLGLFLLGKGRPGDETQKKLPELKISSDLKDSCG